MYEKAKQLARENKSEDEIEAPKLPAVIEEEHSNEEDNDLLVLGEENPIPEGTEEFAPPGGPTPTTVYEPEAVEDEADPIEAQSELTVNAAALNSDPDPKVPKDYKFIEELENKQGWYKACEKEFQNIIKCKVWGEPTYPPEGRKALDTRWVFKMKLNPLNPMEKFEKARLVVKGYEQIPGVDYSESFAPVASDVAIRALVAVSMYYEERVKSFKDWTEQEQWTINVIDVETAFLNANLEEEVYIKIPAGLEKYIGKKFKQGQVLRLHKALYGLVQAPKAWVDTFSKILVNCGLTQCKTEPCVFHQRKIDLRKFCTQYAQPQLMVAIYIDDSLICGEKASIEKLKKLICEHVNITDLEVLSRHLGVDYKFGKDLHGKYIEMSMKPFVDEIVRDAEAIYGKELREFATPGYPNVHLAKHDGVPVNQPDYRSLVGKALYLTKKVEPNCSSSVRELSSFLDCPSDEHWKSLFRLCSYLKFNYQGVRMRTPLELSEVGYSDSDWGNDLGDRKSIGGYVITIGGCIVDWRSKKQTGVTLSSTEAEYVAAADATSIKFLQMLIQELTGEDLRKGVLFMENTGAIKLITNNSTGNRTKHIDIKARFVGDEVKEKRLALQYVKTDENTADIFTKKVVEGLVKKHSNGIYNGTFAFQHRLRIEEDVKLKVAAARLALTQRGEADADVVQSM
jgi:Reverse transcriptase (RNA-dependent DNA polymerase)